MECVHWQWEERDGVFWLGFNAADTSQNVLSNETVAELKQFIESLRDNKTPKGLVIYSLKPNSFIVGADIHSFSAIKDEAEARAVLEEGQALFSTIENLPFPTIALINGTCVGGGLELSLACRYRIAIESDKTRIGLPEILLGIYPGWGGSVRLPRLIGPLKALPLILTGRLVRLREAKRLGIVDAVVPERVVDNAVAHWLAGKGRQKKKSLLHRLCASQLIRPCLAKLFLHQTAKKVCESHYPAPFTMIKTWCRFGESNKAFAAEAKAVAKLMMTDTSRNLVRVFLLRERLLKFGKGYDFPCQHVHVVGAGAMGAGIAAWCVLQGMKVTLQDREAESLSRGLKSAYKLFRKRVRETHLQTACFDRLIPDLSGTGVEQADIIIEAVFEDVAVKTEVLVSIEKRMRHDALLATNTSSIPLKELACHLQQPEKLIGVHFFNPVEKMQLVEVVKTDKTEQATIDAACSFVQKIKRLPLPVLDSPGFVVNRVLTPYLLEAVALLSQGTDTQTIDRAAKSFGMPMGPVELADSVGLDICYAVASHMAVHFHFEIPDILTQRIDAGELGVKSGKGFYQYKNGRKQSARLKPSDSQPVDEKLEKTTQQKLVETLIAESRKVLDEQLVEDGDLVDAGLIFGAGFAPFRGGPLHYSDTTERDH